MPNPFRLAAATRLRLRLGRPLVITLVLLLLAVVYESRWLAYEAAWADKWWCCNSARYEL
jgi:hypothetical protein